MRSAAQTTLRRRSIARQNMAGGALSSAISVVTRVDLALRRSLELAASRVSGDRAADEQSNAMLKAIKARDYEVRALWISVSAISPALLITLAADMQVTHDDNDLLISETTVFGTGGRRAPLQYSAA